MQNRKESFFTKQISPFFQAGIVTAVMLVIMIFLMLVADKEAPSYDPVLFWEMALVLLMFYALFNAIFSFSIIERSVYFRNSIFGFAFVAVAGGLLAKLFSGLSVDEAGSFRWLYMLFTIAYLVFIVIINAMRKIIEMAKREDR